MKMSQKLKQVKSEKPEHWPTLNTVIMVEKTIKDSDKSVMTVAELKRELPRKVNHNTLMVILRYLELGNKIAFGSRGITWIFTPNPIFKKAVEEGFEL